MLGDVPDDWDITPLAHLLKTHYPGDWGEDRGPNMARVIRSTNLTGDGRLDLTDVAVRAIPATKISFLSPKRGDILVERSGGGPGQPVGRVGFVAADLPDHAFSNFLHLLRPDPEKINSRFLGWLLHRINQSGRILRLEQQTTQMRNLHFRDYLNMPLPLPRRDEQIAIARILDAVDTAIEHTRDAIDRATVFCRSLRHQLVTQGLRRAGTKKTPAGTIPKNWSCEQLGRHIQGGPTNGVYRPESDYGSQGTRIVRIDSFADGRIEDPRTLRRVVVPQVIQRRYALTANQILINRVNSLSHIGKAAIVPALDEPTIFESNMMSFHCGPAMLPGFLINILCSDVARRHWLARAKPAVNQASINQRDVRELPIPIPSLHEQREIVEIMVAAHEQIDGHRRVANAQTALKHALMRDLLTGRVRIAVEQQRAAS